MLKRTVICWCAMFCFGAFGLAQTSASKPSGPGNPRQASGQTTTPNGKKKGHSVHLQWKASSTKHIEGYYVYRAEGGATGSYVRLTQKPIRETEYTDVDVALGRTYAYQISTVAMAGKTLMESDRTPPEVVTVPDR